MFACMLYEIHFPMQLVQTHLILHHGSSYSHLCEQNEIINIYSVNRLNASIMKKLIGLLMFERGKNKSKKLYC